MKPAPPVIKYLVLTARCPRVDWPCKANPIAHTSAPQGRVSLHTQVLAEVVALAGSSGRTASRDVGGPRSAGASSLGKAKPYTHGDFPAAA
jgi:hypothetical protein